MALRVMTLDVAPYRKNELVELDEGSPQWRWSEPVGGVIAETIAEAVTEDMTDGPSEDQPDTDQPDTPDEPKGGNRSSKGRRGSSD